MLKELAKNAEHYPQVARIMFFREHEIEALLVNVNEVFSHLIQILEHTKFSSGYGDFMLVTEDFHFGLCIERTEYFYELSTWRL
ncbi:hypothetical protein C6W18_17740 [Bacillus sp. LLTC93]|nr:hypothetical protein C6W18_17740 [Bacillus sp. LLTC93]